MENDVRKERGNKIKDILGKIGIILFTLIGDFVVIFSIVYFILNAFDWYYIILLLMITVPVLYFFNKGSIAIIKDFIKKNKDKSDE